MESILKLYDNIVELCPRFERKGKNNPYTSANGYMFSMINKDNEFGIRFSKEVQEKYMEEFGTGSYMSYGAVMRGYVHIPDELLSNNTELIISLLNESYDYVNSLPPK